MDSDSPAKHGPGRPRQAPTVRVPLAGPILLELPDGSEVRVLPGPRGFGLAIVPVRPIAPGHAITPATRAVRARMAADNRAGKLRDAAHYVQWLIDWHLAREDSTELPHARTIVRRELERLASRAKRSKT